MVAHSPHAEPATSVEPLLIIVGPTASGKSTLALTLAERHGGEIVSADSVQIYRYFDIGSGKPNTAELERVPHHGIGLLEPTDEMDASVFGDRASEWISDIRQRGRLPIVCGGTFLWIRSLVYGLVAAPAKDEHIREAHRLLVEREGRAALHERLSRVDQASALRLNPNDFVRVSRALEVHELTGVPLSQLQERHAFATPRHRPIYVGIEHGKEPLKARIETRIHQMLDAGWLEEVRSLLARGFAETRAMNSVGYRQLKAALLMAELPGRETLVSEISQATRVYSRRQRTWLRDKAVTWLTPEQASSGDLGRRLSAELYGRPGP